MRPRTFSSAAALALASLTTAVWADRGASPAAGRPSSATPVIVELFTSEGCSSCPSADAWLAALDRRQPIEGVSVLALEEHVDYWDDLGWRDPFGQAPFGDRQRAYAHVLADHQVYTPEIVIDGRVTVQNGDDEGAARELRASAAAPRATVSVGLHGDRVAIDVSDVPASSEDAEIWLAVTETGLASDVTRGENAGRRLVHAPVVRTLRRVGVARDGGFHGELPADAALVRAPRSIRVVAFVQRERSRRIVGAGVL